MPGETEKQLFLKVIACEIAVREVYHAAAQCRHLVDLEFVTQGHHDTPAQGVVEIQQRIDAVPSGKYDAILLVYGLCSNILAGLRTAHTPLVIPRAHDCITLFLGSRRRYQECFSERPGTYYYTSGWLECARRRGEKGAVWGGYSLPATANASLQGAYQEWVTKFGEDQAKYLLEEMSRWSSAYSHGTLIEFDFTKPLMLEGKVRAICQEKGWEYSELPGDLGLFHSLLNGHWPESDFLTVQPGQKVAPSYDESVIAAV